MNATFDEQVKQAIQQKILKEVRTMDFTKLSYNERFKIPDQFISDMWAAIDWSVVMEHVRPELEKRICNSIVGNMEAEIKTDVKAILSIDGVRQRLRAEVYPNIMAIVKDSRNGDA